MLPKKIFQICYLRTEKQKYFEFSSEKYDVVRGDKYYFINNKKQSSWKYWTLYWITSFYREFKGQLHRYLNIHRIIWEKIDNIKDKVNVKGSEIVKFTTKLEGYSKTVNLIDGRINQMSTYISTREKIVKADPELTEFLAISGYRYETLRDTLNYIQYLWDMTQTHLNQAKSLFSEIKSDVTNSSVSNLTVVTSMSAGASLLGLLNESLPTVNLMGFVYFLILALIGWISTKILSFIGKQRKYEVTDVEYDKDIKWNEYVQIFKNLLKIDNNKLFVIIQMFISSGINNITSLLPPIATSGIIAMITIIILMVFGIL